MGHVQSRAPRGPACDMSPRQRGMILALMRRAEYDMQHVNAFTRGLAKAAKVREPGAEGTVEDWIDGLDRVQASRLIDHLQRKANAPDTEDLRRG